MITGLEVVPMKYFGAFPLFLERLGLFSLPPSLFLTSLEVVESEEENVRHSRPVPGEAAKPPLLSSLVLLSSLYRY
jgi:hypothetical protein